jgi:hypothetical protein
MINENIKNMVEKPHLINSNYYDYWNFMIESYEGGIDYSRSHIVKGQLGVKSIKIEVNGKPLQTYANCNLFQHPKEKNEDYMQRIRMSYYYNFCAPIIDIYTDHLFKQSINSDFANIDKDVQFRSEDIDRKGSSITEFRKEVAEYAQILGHIIVICDLPNVETDILTFQDLIDFDSFPYFSIHLPQNIINWSLDRFGQPYWVLAREFADINTDPEVFNKEAADLINYRLWTRTEWILFNSGYEEISRGFHNLGRVPITCIFNKSSKKQRNFLGISDLADIAFIAKDVYNSCSELKQILRDQTFSILALQGDATDYNALSVGTSKGVLYPEGKNPPQYVSPPEANARVYFDHIDRQVSKIFQLAKLEGGSASYNGQVAQQQSGVSKAWDFNQTNSALAKKAGNLEDGETKLWQLFALWQGKEFDGSIQYPVEFSIQTLKADMDEAEQAFRLNLGKEFNLEVKKAIIKKKFPRASEKEQQTMIDEMESQEGKSEGGRLIDRRPDLFNKATIDANSGGK